MPRTPLAADKYKDKDLCELIRRYKYGMDLTNASAAKAIGVCESTWNNYLTDPGRIPLKKIRAIQKKFRIPKEEMLRLLI